MSLNMKTRRTMVNTLPHNGIVAEIGVQRGDFAEIILHLAYPQELHLIDCWELQDKSVYGDDPANVPQAIQDENERITRDRFKDHPEVKIHKSFSKRASFLFEDNTFDWVYLDANHLRLKEELDLWVPKVKSGGWVAGHDYCVFGDFINVQPVLDEYVQEHNRELLVVTDEDFPSWAFRKD